MPTVTNNKPDTAPESDRNINKEPLFGRRTFGRILANAAASLALSSCGIEIKESEIKDSVIKFKVSMLTEDRNPTIECTGDELKVLTETLTKMGATIDNLGNVTLKGQFIKEKGIKVYKVDLLDNEARVRQTSDFLYKVSIPGLKDRYISNLALTITK